MINKLLNLEIKNFFWIFLTRKISRIFKIYFVFSAKNYLPKNNYPLHNLNLLFENQYNNFHKNNFNFNKDLFHNLKGCFLKNKTIKILDYGGENLDLYLFLKKKFPKATIIVINQKKLNNVLKNFIKKKKIKNIQVFSDIKKINNIKLDLVYFGSSLQYMKNYEEILKFLLKKKVKYFCISATSFFYSKKFNKKIILKQVNLLPYILYCYSFNFIHINSLFSKYGYKIINKKFNPYKKINFRNFSIKVEYLNIQYKKLTSKIS